jgi:predicted nucleotidyltransferase
MIQSLQIDHAAIEAYCRKWMIREFAFFGSVLRKDFGSASDIDVLIDFEPNIPWSLYEWIDMIDELEEMFGRKVDLVSKDGLRNPFRRKRILKTREIIYGGC